MAAKLAIEIEKLSKELDEVSAGFKQFLAELRRANEKLSKHVSLAAEVKD